MPNRPTMPLMAPYMPPQPSQEFAPDPDKEWLLEIMRQGRMREELRAGGIDPEQTGMAAVRDFATQAPIELGMSLVPAMRAFPKVTGAAAGLGAYFGGTSEAGSSDENVLQLQQQLQEAGFYDGPLDGKMGPRTRAAQQQFEQDRMQREQMQVQQQQAEADKMRAQAEAERVQFEREQAEREAAQREAGETRMREMDENTPWYRQALRDYGPLAGYGLGALAGMATRRGMTRSFAGQSEKAAAQANQMVSGQGDLPQRMGGVNRFYQEGGATELPFTPAPTSRFGMRSNPQAPSAATLHQPPPRVSEFVRARDLGVLAGAGAEAGVGHQMAEGARAEVQEAYEAVERDPSEANIQRLQAAMDRAAMWDFTGNIGRGMALGYAGMAPKMRYQSTRPDVAAGEAERVRLDQMINPQRGRAPSGPSAPQAPSAPLGVPHHASLQPRKGGKFAGPPKYPKGDPRRK